MKGKNYNLIYMILFLSLLGLGIFALGWGSVDIDSRDIMDIISYKLKLVSELRPGIKKSQLDIIWKIRLPRVILSALVGSGLALSGLIMQATVKNPLADPYILGISSGASLGATLSIMLGFGSFYGGNFIGFFAFCGAFISSIMVLLLARSGGRVNSTRLVLSGMALSSLSSALSTFIIYIAKNQEGIRTVTYWMMGSLSASSWKDVILVGTVVALGSLYFITQFRTLNLMLLGDDIAITLGKNLYTYRIIYTFVSALIVGMVVYSVGIIGFVGLIIPHVVRMVFGNDHRFSIPLNLLIGAIFLMAADLVSRTILPGSELPIGVLIAIIGSPVFIYLMNSRSYGFGGS